MLTVREQEGPGDVAISSRAHVLGEVAGELFIPMPNNQLAAGESSRKAECDSADVNRGPGCANVSVSAIPGVSSLASTYSQCDLKNPPVQ